MQGRFARSKEPPATPMSGTATTALSDVLGEDELKAFLSPMLQRLIPVKNDANLFIKVCAADGMET